MRWSSHITNNIIAGTICGIFALLFLFGIRALTIYSDKREVTLNDIFPARDIDQNEPASYVARHTSRQEPDMPKTNVINRAETDGNDKVRIDYYIIVGSFRNLIQAQEKAEKLINDLNTNIIILPPTKESLYRISYGKYSTYEDAKTTIKSKSIRETISSDIWILSVKE